VDTERVDVLTLMASLAGDVAAVPVARAVFILAQFLAAHSDSLSDEQAATLLALGAGLWQRSIILEDTDVEIEAMLGTRQ
jgi:hypothetical protein